MGAQALSGVRALDLSDGVAGVYCARMLAAAGAEVIKIEPPGGDPLRQAGPFPNDTPHPERGGLFIYLNGGKRSLTLDITAAGGAGGLQAAR